MIINYLKNGVFEVRIAKYTAFEAVTVEFLYK